MNAIEWHRAEAAKFRSMAQSDLDLMVKKGLDDRLAQYRAGLVHRFLSFEKWHNNAAHALEHGE